METVQVCDRQFLYSGVTPPAQRKVISSGAVRKEKVLTVSP